MDQRIYAFWRYDKFPYFLGGEVLRFLDEGHIAVSNYHGSIFKPVKIVPLEMGKKKQSEIDNIKAEYQIKQRLLQKEYTDKIEQIMGISANGND